MSEQLDLAEKFVAFAKKRGDLPSWDLVETAFTVGLSQAPAPSSSPSEVREALARIIHRDLIKRKTNDCWTSACVAADAILASFAVRPLSEETT